MSSEDSFSKALPAFERSVMRADTFHGQHFLVDQAVVNAIVEQVPVGADCVEIGAGTGLLTGPLIDKVGQHGKVVAYEIDERCLPVLGSLRVRGNLEVRHQDFLEVESTDLNHLNRLHLIGNVPYHILEPLLRKMVDIDFETAVLMLPNRFRDTVMARHTGDKEWRKSSIVAAAFFRTTAVVEVPREAFDPAPPVDSTVVKFTRSDRDNDVAPEPIVHAYRALARTLTTNETVASALRSVSVRPDGTIAGVSAQKDQLRHRKERRQKTGDMRQLAREWNQHGSISQETLHRTTGLNLLEIATKALGNKANEINAPMGAIDTNVLRRVCSAIEAAINRGRKLGSF